MVDSYLSRRRMLVVLAAMCALATFWVRAETASAAPEIDAKVAELMDKYVAATGGKAAYDKVKNRVTKMTMEIADQGIKLNMTVYAAKPNKSYVLIESDLTGKIEQGCDGEIAWANTTTTGPQILEGAQKATIMRDGVLDRFTYWRNVYVGAKYEGMEDVEGTKCHKLVLTPKPVKDGPEDDTQTLYIDPKTNYIVKLETKVESPAGVVPVTVLLSDYKEVDGIKLAHKTTMKVMGTARNMTIDEVKNNADLPADRFALPAEVKELLK
jgi:outer membrane lipoprotein-sorting protein